MVKPDVVVMDIHMPDLNGIDATRQIVAEFPGAKIIAFSMHTDHQFVTGALKAGVSGYLQKDSAFEELVQASAPWQPNRPTCAPRSQGTWSKAMSKNAGERTRRPCFPDRPGT